jgi:hypothetical protein
MKRLPHWPRTDGSVSEPSDEAKAEFWNEIEQSLRRAFPTARLIYGNANGPFFWNYKHVEIEGDEHITLDLDIDGNVMVHTFCRTFLRRLNPETARFERNLARAVRVLHYGEPARMAKLEEIFNRCDSAAP